MSTGGASRHYHHHTLNSTSAPNAPTNIAPPPPLEQYPRSFEPCAATASFFLYAQLNSILVLHHDTLAIERKCGLHQAPVSMIVADNVSESGAGRHIVSYDVGQNAFIWDVFTGLEIARFASFEQVLAMAFMRNGNVAFGNSQGSITLFEPATTEHINARTIYDPITALAPASDCRTFAIGYMNGSILIAKLQPFVILHTLTSNRTPSPVAGLAWHGSSSRAATEMLATQTVDGTTLVYSVAKTPNPEQPRVIRVLGSSDAVQPGSSWFSWSKSGRIVQYADGSTKAHDVRTKQVNYVNVPTVDDVVAIANYGPTATLFTLGRNHMVQQYDLNPAHAPSMVANIQHVPPNAPPTPPDSVGLTGMTPPPLPIDHPVPPVPTDLIYTSEEEEGMMSPLERIEQEMDQLEEERRDLVGPLSPVSSHASLSSASSTGRGVRYKSKSRTRERSFSSRTSEAASEGTQFSGISGSAHSAHNSVSIRSMSSAASTTSSRQHGSSRLRHQMLRSPDESHQTHTMDLFPYTKARLSEVRFKAAQYPQGNATTDALRQEMLNVVFGWEHDIEALVRDEQSRHRQGSATSVLLSRWLGDLNANAQAQMMASETMSSSDWMLLALSSMSGNSAKQLGEAYVRTLLEKDDIHPAVGILLGFGEHNDAVEAYVSRGYYMEAVLLTCLVFPHDWQRQSYLVRKWGEAAVKAEQAELAVRCFSCTSIESSEAWFSPRAQDAVYAAQQEQFMSPLSPPPSATASNRLKEKNAALRLITSFGEKGQAKPGIGVTPIADSALTPGGHSRWRSSSKVGREPSTARTATPGGYKRTRMPSSGPHQRYLGDDDATPMVETARPSSRAHSRLGEKDPDTAVRARRNLSESLPSPAPGVFSNRRAASRPREPSRNRHNLHLKVERTSDAEAMSPGPSTTSTANSSHRHRRSNSSLSQETRPEDFSPLLTDGSVKSYKGRSIDRYIASLEEANANAQHAQHLRAESRSRLEQRHERSRSRPRKNSESTYIKPAKRSPRSPKSMSTEEAGKYSNQNDESTYDVSSPVENKHGRTYSSARSATSRVRGESRSGRRAESPERLAGRRSASKTAGGRAVSRDDRGRSHSRVAAGNRSPSSPSPMDASGRSARNSGDTQPVQSIGARARQRSSSRRASESGRRTTSPDRASRARSSSRRPKYYDSDVRSATTDRRFNDIAEEAFGDMASEVRPPLTRKELAAKELEERRLSLARRPSAPQSIVSPDMLQIGNVRRPSMGDRSITADNSDLATLPSSTYSDFIPRSRTADPDSMNRNAFDRVTGISTSSAPIGLPATPRAMRHPRYMRRDSKEDGVPAVPALPEQHAIMQPAAPEAEDTLAPLLPSTRYNSKAAPPRSASAPPERMNGPPSTGLPARPRKASLTSNTKSGSSHSRRASEREDIPEITALTIDEEDPSVIVVQDTRDHADTMSAVLPELQHLAGPPPPPPPPPLATMFPPGFSLAQHGASPASANTSSGVIDVFISDGGDRIASPPTTSASPNAARKYSASQQGTNDSLSSRLRGVRDRMRSESRSRNQNTKSPPIETAGAPNPYETVIPGFTTYGEPERSASAQSMGGSVTGYRHPKEVRAAMAQGPGAGGYI